MSIWKKLFGYSPSTARNDAPQSAADASTPKEIFIFRVDDKSWSVIVKESFIAPLLVKYSDRMRQACQTEGVPIPDTPQHVVILKIVAGISGLQAKVDIDAHIAAATKGSPLVQRVDKCGRIVTPNLTPDWDVPGYWISYFCDLH